MSEFETLPMVEMYKPQDKCGVSGVYAPDLPAAEFTYLMQYELQHRGQDAAGIAVPSGDTMIAVKDVGLVTEVFQDGAGAVSLDGLRTGPIAIGHNRYTTDDRHGNSIHQKRQNAHPITGETSPIAVGHNGEFVGLEAALDRLGLGYLQDTSDTRLFTKALDVLTTKYGDLVKGSEVLLPEVEGAYALVMADLTRLIGARDHKGIRPLVVAQFADNKGWALASEDSAFNNLDVDIVSIRDVMPGEMVVIDDTGLTSYIFKEVKPEDERLCIFEYVYIARPDTNLRGVNVQKAREWSGSFIVEDYPSTADILTGTPESGRSAAKGASRVSGIPEEEGLTKSRYVGRTFIQEGQANRIRTRRLKYHANRSVLTGNETDLYDDSQVRGTTMTHLVGLLRRFGATRVNVRISSPPYRFSCPYGVDTPFTDELFANDPQTGLPKTEEQMAAELGAESVRFLRPERLIAAIERAREDTRLSPTHQAASKVGGFCTACFTGDYVIPVDSVRMKTRDETRTT